MSRGDRRQTAGVSALGCRQNSTAWGGSDSAPGNRSWRPLAGSQAGRPLPPGPQFQPGRGGGAARAPGSQRRLCPRPLATGSPGREGGAGQGVGLLRWRRCRHGGGAGTRQLAWVGVGVKKDPPFSPPDGPILGLKEKPLPPLYPTQSTNRISALDVSGAVWDLSWQNGTAGVLPKLASN